MDLDWLTGIEINVVCIGPVTGMFFSSTLNIMFKTCPHCFVVVLPKTNGDCPNCSCLFSADANHLKAAITVTKTTRFPDICHQCGIKTQEIGELVEWTRHEEFVDDVNSLQRMFIFVVSIIFMPFTILMGTRAGVRETSQKQRLKIPTCANCDSSKTKILDCCPERNQFRIVVHKEFAEVLQRE
jgi:hypothetical protein